MAVEKKSASAMGRSLASPKIRPIMAILFTTLISCLLVWQRNTRSVGRFYNAVMSNPGTAGFFKQIIASMLGFLWVYVAGAIFNLTTRLRLTSPERTPSLQALNVWVACGVQRIDFSLPLHYIALTALVVLAAQAIGSVWGGAITPVMSPITYGDFDQITSPVFNPPWFTSQFPDQGDATDFDDSLDNVCQTINGLRGFIPTCPIPGLQNLVLGSARSATTYDGSQRVHSKNDNPSWSYFGRSYGVGSSTGIEPLPNSTDSLLSYQYYETGYFVKSTCEYNSSSAFNLTTVFKNFQPSNGSDISLSVLLAAGQLPNSDLDSDRISFPLVLTNQTSNPAILTWAATSKFGINIASLAGTGTYEPFNNIQCNIAFVQKNFSLAVNVSSFTIEVTPLNTIDLSVSNDFDKENYLISNAMASLDLLAQTAASLTYENLGEALADNWQTFNESIGYENNVTGSHATHGIYNTSAVYLGNETSILGAVEASFDAMLDDIIGGYGAAQLYWGQNVTLDGTQADVTTSLPLYSQYAAIRLGQDGYIFATLAINLVILIIAIEEAIRTRNWKRITALDYMNLKSVIVATSAAGTAIADDCHERHEEGKHWDGKSQSKEAAGVRVRVVQGSAALKKGPMIALAKRGDLDVYDGKEESAESDSLVMTTK